MNRCQHGVYWPEGHAIAFCCGFCNPTGNDENATPILPASGLALNSRQTESLSYCEHCGNVRTFSSKTCRVCLTPFPEAEDDNRRQGSANSKQPGVCPKCGSAVHYVSKKPKTWACADCDTEYPAPKRLHE